MDKQEDIQQVQPLQQSETKAMVLMPMAPGSSEAAMFVCNSNGNQRQCTVDDVKSTLQELNASDKIMYESLANDLNTNAALVKTVADYIPAERPEGKPTLPTPATVTGNGTVLQGGVSSQTFQPVTKPVVQLPTGGEQKVLQPVFTTSDELRTKYSPQASLLPTIARKEALGDTHTIAEDTAVAAALMHIASIKNSYGINSPNNTSDVALTGFCKQYWSDIGVEYTQADINKFIKTFREYKPEAQYPSRYHLPAEVMKARNGTIIREYVNPRPLQMKLSTPASTTYWRGMAQSVSAVGTIKPHDAEYTIAMDFYKDPVNNLNTVLNDKEEKEYQKWFKEMQDKGMINKNDVGYDYDFRGAFKNKEVPSIAEDGRYHWSDRYKKPNHPTFSKESIYAKGLWSAFAGEWENGEYIPASLPYPIKEQDKFYSLINSKNEKEKQKGGLVDRVLNRISLNEIDSELGKSVGVITGAASPIDQSYGDYRTPKTGLVRSENSLNVFSDPVFNNAVNRFRLSTMLPYGYYTIKDVGVLGGMVHELMKKDDVESNVPVVGSILTNADLYRDNTGEIPIQYTKDGYPIKSYIVPDYTGTELFNTARDAYYDSPFLYSMFLASPEEKESVKDAAVNRANVLQGYVSYNETTPQANLFSATNYYNTGEELVKAHVGISNDNIANATLGISPATVGTKAVSAVASALASETPENYMQGIVQLGVAMNPEASLTLATANADAASYLFGRQEGIEDALTIKKGDKENQYITTDVLAYALAVLPMFQGDNRITTMLGRVLTKQDTITAGTAVYADRYTREAAIKHAKLELAPFEDYIKMFYGPTEASKMIDNYAELSLHMAATEGGTIDQEAVKNAAKTLNSGLMSRTTEPSVVKKIFSGGRYQYIKFDKAGVKQLGLESKDIDLALTVAEYNLQSEINNDKIIPMTGELIKTSKTALQLAATSNATPLEIQSINRGINDQLTIQAQTFNRSNAKIRWVGYGTSLIPQVLMNDGTFAPLGVITQVRSVNGDMIPQVVPLRISLRDYAEMKKEGSSHVKPMLDKFGGDVLADIDPIDGKSEQRINVYQADPNKRSGVYLICSMLADHNTAVRISKLDKTEDAKSKAYTKSLYNGLESTAQDINRFSNDYYNTLYNLKRDIQRSTYIRKDANDASIEHAFVVEILSRLYVGAYPDEVNFKDLEAVKQAYDVVYKRYTNPSLRARVTRPIQEGVTGFIKGTAGAVTKMYEPVAKQKIKTEEEVEDILKEVGGQ